GTVVPAHQRHVPGLRDRRRRAQLPAVPRELEQPDAQLPRVDCQPVHQPAGGRHLQVLHDRLPRADARVQLRHRVPDARTPAAADADVPRRQHHRVLPGDPTVAQRSRDGRLSRAVPQTGAGDARAAAAAAPAPVFSLFMRRILVTNDDGYFSPGIQALAEALKPFGEVTIVAPQTEASAVGHALTLRRPLRFEAIGPGVWAVDGTPTDCVNIALSQLYPDGLDLIVSGINKGLNIGDDVTYSGTVAGALEGALLGYQAVAFSLEQGPGGYDFGRAAAIAADVVASVLEDPLPVRSFLNVNVPVGTPRGI